MSLAVDAVCTENDHYPEFVDRAVTVSASPSLRRGDVVALLEARDADLVRTCRGHDCPCARLAYAVEAGDTAGLFDVDRSTGRVSVAADDLASHDGQTVQLDVSVVNDVTTGDDVRGPKNYASNPRLPAHQQSVTDPRTTPV